MGDNRVKVTASTLSQMKKLFDAGTKQRIIANAFDVSISTVQNAKRCNFDFTAYKEFVDGQFKQWKLSKNTSTNISKFERINAEAEGRMDWIHKKLASIEIRLRTLEIESQVLNNK